MPIGFNKRSNGDEYIFIDGKAMKADEAVRIDLQAEAASVPGMEDAANQSPVQDDNRKKKWSARKALDELEHSDAFEMNEGFAQALAPNTLMVEDKRRTRNIALVLGALLLLVTLFALCISVDFAGQLYSPVDVARSFAERVRLGVGQLFSLDYYNALSENEAANAISGYGDMCNRMDVTFVTLICGFLLALAGMMYQNVFRNPIASPTMLGVSAGVRVGTIILVIIYGVAAVDLEGERYALCYAGGILVLLVVVGFSKLVAGKGRRINVVDMLLVGSVASQLLATLTQYFITYWLDDDQWEAYYEVMSGMRADYDWSAYVFLLIIVVIAVVPVFLVRFRLNVISFDDGDVKLLGVDPSRIRVFVLIMGTLMILAAQIHVGVISMISLVVPFIVRYIVGSEFRKQLIGNMLMGPLMLMVCRVVCSMIPFVGSGLSLEMVVGFVALPLYIWMMALGQKGWE